VPLLINEGTKTRAITRQTKQVDSPVAAGEPENIRLGVVM